MSFRLVPKSVTLNGVMALAGALRYVTDFGKHAFQHNGVDLWWNLCTSLLYACTMSSVRKFTFAISSPDKFLVGITIHNRRRVCCSKRLVKLTRRRPHPFTTSASLYSIPATAKL